MDELKRKGMFATMMFLCGCLLTAGTAMTEAKALNEKQSETVSIQDTLCTAIREWNETFRQQHENDAAEILSIVNGGIKGEADRLYVRDSLVVLLCIKGGPSGLGSLCVRCNETIMYEEKMKENSVSDEDAPLVTDQDMEKIVEEKTKIPVGELKAKEQSQLKNLAASLESHVIGQNQAVDKVARAIRRNRVGFNKSGRPIGSFLFVGPTGVGKTETAKQLAKELFGTEDSMIRFDMSEYMEKFSVSKLIGSPPGYVGYEEAGQLTEQVRRHPYSLILLDEVEKAHPDVMHMFLQILDDGRLTDSQGRTVSFKDTIIIMTSNAGSGDSVVNVGFGAEASGKSNSVIDKLTKYFKPEFLNRFDGIIEFNALSKEDLTKIVRLMLADVNDMLAPQGLSLHVTAPVEAKLVDLGYDPKMGARPLRRVIQEQLEDRIADYFLDHPTEKQLVAKVENGEIKITNQTTETSN